MAPHSSILAWKIPWAEEPGGLQSMGSLRVGHDFGFSLSCIGEGNGNPLQDSCLENPRDGGAWWAAVYGVAQSRTWLKWLRSSSSSSSVQSLSHVRLFVTPWIAAHQASLSITKSQVEFTKTHVHRVGDAIPPSHPLSSPSFPAFNLSQHQGLFQWVSSLHQVAKVLEFQFQHPFFQWIFRIDFLQDWLVWCSFSSRDSQESSPTPQFTPLRFSYIQFNLASTK